MDADENDIITYLKVWTGQYVSAREIARKAASKRRYENEPDWAVSVLGRLAEKGLVESDSMAHYRLVPDAKKEKPRRWISPQMQKILDKTGKDFSEGVEIAEPPKTEPSTPPPGGEKKPADREH